MFSGKDDVICARYLNLADEESFGASLTTIARIQGEYVRIVQDFASVEEALKETGPILRNHPLGLKTQEGALYIGMPATNIELLDTVGSYQCLRISFAPSLSKMLDLCVWGSVDFVYRAFVLAATLARSKCDLKFKCLQPINAEFGEVACRSNPCLASEMLRIGNFIDFWVSSDYVTKLTTQRKQISSEYPSLNIRGHGIFEASSAENS